MDGRDGSDLFLNRGDGRTPKNWLKRSFAKNGRDHRNLDVGEGDHRGRNDDALTSSDLNGLET